MQLDISDLQLESQQRERDFEKKLHELHKRVNAKQSQHELDDKKSNDDERPAIAGTRPKGYLYKGTPFLRGNAEDKQKITELKDYIKDNAEQLLLLTLEKRSLQETIIHLITERADEFGLTEEEKRIQLSRLNLPSVDGVQMSSMAGADLA